MKKILLLFCCIPLFAASQTYQSYNVSLLAHISPNTSTTSLNKYSGCWGWHQSGKNREYAIAGASNGTYFIDVTNPANPVVCDFVKAAHDACTWREMKTYQKYCYIVSDVCEPNNFQIVDMSYLPDSVHVVHNSSIIFNRGHTVWIDKDKMYVGLVKFAFGNSAMAVYSLANPESPGLLRRIEEDSLNINEVHDMYVRNDTIYASAGWQGLHVLRLTATNTIERIGEYSAYPFHGYNHSSWLTQNGKYLLFCDEVPGSLPMKLVDVQNLGNIQPVKHWQPAIETTPHNPYVIGNSQAVVSCYQDGLWFYNISDPNKISLSGYFDTYPEGGMNKGDYGGNVYEGNWGAYPYLPSGIVIANDMQNGVFILNPTAAYNTTVTNPVGLTNQEMAGKLGLFPNPSRGQVNLHHEINGKVTVRVANTLGQTVYEEQAADRSLRLDLSHLQPGPYLISVSNNRLTSQSKLILQRP